MNILMLSHYAGAPQYGMEYRSYYMSREWVKAGHKVMIAGASFSHLRKQQPAVERENLEGIEYLWLKTRSYEGNGLARVLTMVQFVLECYRNKQLFIDFKPDVVIASSVYTFDIYPAHYIAKKCGAKLIYEVHDLWPLSPMVIGGYSKYHPFIWLLQRGENYAYKHVDLVVSMLDKAFPHMQRHGLDEKRFVCVPNGYLAEEWSNTDTQQLPQQHLELLQSLQAEGKTLIGFAGGLTQSTAMQVFVEAADKLRSNPNLSFIAIGQGPQKEELIQMANDKKLTNIYFLPSIPKTLIPKAISYFDICYMGGVHSILHKYGTSFNKMTDYMLSQKPIIMSVDEPDSVVQGCGCGIQVEAENVDQVAKAIIDIACLSKEERTTMGRKGYDYAVEHLEYATLAKQFLQSIK
ncbi:MAG: glycosyltransferase family 4 protein [Bacteroidales bacterium]|nr:glycosyltransferase family 4 protein [Bacteroidales bacterium]